MVAEGRARDAGIGVQLGGWARALEETPTWLNLARESNEPEGLAFDSRTIGARACDGLSTTHHS
jgi:hypothetical protein